MRLMKVEANCTRHQRDQTSPLLRVEGLSVHFSTKTADSWSRRHDVVHAVDDVSFDIYPEETLGLVGESGSGKTSTGRAVMLMIRPTAGRIWFKNQDITDLRGEALRRTRRDMQFIFQDPYGSINPRMDVLSIVSEPLVVHGLVQGQRDTRNRVSELLELVGLPSDAMHRYPHAFSGGQRQRIGIARALALHPAFIVADEAVSALDVSIRAQVMNLMQDLQQRLGMSYLFIAHDLSVVRSISQRIAIMYAGKIVELADRNAIFQAPRHPYTEALLSAVPVPDPKVERTRRRILLHGELPNPISPPSGCRFHTRCPIAVERCKVDAPPLEEKEPNHWAACWLT